MPRKINKWWKSFIKELKLYPWIYLILAGVLASALFLRIYNVGNVLGFYFDQGRDALVIWDLWHKGDFFLIGPTTGIEGIFRGPFYYYLIAPFYLFGGGDPVWPAIFLAVLSVSAIALLYYLGKEIQDRATGLLAAVIASFSFYIIIASRWLSNPTPMLLFSVILVWTMLLVVKGKKWAWPVIAFVAGSSLFHFGSAGELFYFLAIFVFALWQRKNLPNKRYLWMSVVVFIFTALPQLLFETRNGWILTQNIKRFLVEDSSFKLSFWEVVKQRFNFYYDVFSNKIFVARSPKEVAFLSIIALYFIFYFRKFWKNDGVKILVLLLLSPMLGLLFFQGNFGNIYDYYLTGYYLPFILLFALVLGMIWRSLMGKVFVIVFLYIFVTLSVPIIWPKIADSVDKPQSVALRNELQAVDWVFNDAQTRGEFNVDVYVPPVIPYAYDYLFLWQATLRQNEGCSRELCGLVTENLTETLYTIQEIDSSHPERIRAWQERQDGIGKVLDEVQFGGITVQRRIRL